MFPRLSNEQIIKVFVKLFNHYEFCDVVLKKFTELQTEFIPEEYYIRKKDFQKSGNSCPSCWADCYKQFDVQKCETSDFNIDVESYKWEENTMP